MTDAALEDVSGLDSLFYDVQLTDESTGAPLTSGVVQVVLTRSDTVTPLDPFAAVCSLSHVAAGRWTGTHSRVDVATAIAGVPIGRQFDRVLIVDNFTNGRRLARCRRVAVKDN